MQSLLYLFAGLGSTCNHIAAILFKVDFAWQHGMTQKTCTSLPCKWNVPSLLNNIQHKPISELEWRKPHYSKKGEKKTINPMVRTLFNPSRSKESPNLESLLHALYDSCPSSCAFQYALPLSTPAFSPEDDVNVGTVVECETGAFIPPSISSQAKDCSSVDELLEKLPTFTPDQAEALEKSTRGQWQSPLWKEQRQGRITASLVYRVVTRMHTAERKPDTDTTNLIKSVLGITKPNEDLPALKYGRVMESEAKLKYIQVMKTVNKANVMVNECGLFVLLEMIYLGATPDGIVYDSTSSSEGILEIKCPYRIANDNPSHQNLDYLEKCEQGSQLKCNHSYYYQIQTQLGVTGKEWCDFFVYTKAGYFLERVHLNQEVWDDIKACVKEFFTKHLAQKLVS